MYSVVKQIVCSPNSSATFRKSCTTFGRRNYLLRLSQIFKNQCYLTGLLERLKEDYITNFTAAQLFFSRWWTKVMPKLSAFSRMTRIHPVCDVLLRTPSKKMCPKRDIQPFYYKTYIDVDICLPY